MKKCPFCAEEIQDDAIVCKHCGRTVDEAFNLKKANLGRRIDSLVSDGWKIISQTESAAVLEKRGYSNALSWGLVLMFWPAGILYAIPGIRKKYRTTVSIAPDSDHVIMNGNTPRDVEAGKKTADTIGWVLIVIAVLAFLILLASSCN